MKKAIIGTWIVDHVNKRATQDIKIVDAPTKNNLQFFYDQIGCKMIDVVSFEHFDAYVNDEGLLESGNIVAEYNGIPLAGNLVITKGIDTQGNTVWFDEHDHKEMMAVTMVLERALLKGITA